MTEMPTKQITDLWIALNRAQRAALGRVERDLKSAGFPPLSWYDVLLELERTHPEGLRLNKLEDQLLLPQHSVSRLISRMAEDGLVIRQQSNDDKRGQIAIITPDGTRLRREMWRVYGQAIEKAVGSRIGTQSVQLATRLLRQIACSDE